MVSVALIDIKHSVGIVRTLLFVCYQLVLLRGHRYCKSSQLIFGRRHLRIWYTYRLVLSLAY